MARSRRNADPGPFNASHQKQMQDMLKRVRKAREQCARYERVGVNCQDFRGQLDDVEAAVRQFQAEFFPQDIAAG